LTIKHGVVSAGMSTPRAQDPAFYEDALAFLQRSLTALGHVNGVFHAEAFHQNGAWIFSEMAMRCGGGGIPLYHEVVTGWDLFGSFAQTALRLPTRYAGALFPDDNRYTGFTVLPAPEGVIASYPSAEEIRARPGVIGLELEVPAGKRFPSMALGTFVKIGSAILAADSESEFLRHQRELTEWFAANVKVL